MATTRKRGEPRPPKTDAASVRAGVEADKARKAASKRALRDANVARQTRLHEEAKAEAKPVPRETPAEVTAAKKLAEAQAALKTQLEDFTAIHPDKTGLVLGQPSDEFVAYLAEQGYNPDGTVKEEDAKPGYDGPMVALKRARLSYVKSARGILCNGDELAVLCGAYPRDVVVRTLITVLKLEGNPWAHLNPGQQSMNARNKARKALKDGFIKIADIEAALKEAK